MKKTLKNTFSIDTNIMIREVSNEESMTISGGNGNDGVGGIERDGVGGIE